MLAMQRTKSKRGRKLKSRLINVMCQTEVTTTYLQCNKIVRGCSKANNTFNRKRILKIIREYFNEKQNCNVKKCSLVRYIKRKQKCVKVSKTKSANSVIYMGTKKLKNKQAVNRLATKSVVYIGTTYNTLETTQNNDIIDLTQAEPALKRTHMSTEKSLFVHNHFPKTTTKYFKRPLFNSVSDSVLFIKSKEICDIKRKHLSDYAVYAHKKFKPDSTLTDRSMCLKELMNIKLPQLNEYDELRDCADSSENTDPDFLKINDEVSEDVSTLGNDTTESMNVTEDVSTIRNDTTDSNVTEDFPDIVAYAADNKLVNDLEIMENLAFDVYNFNVIENNTRIAGELNKADKSEEHVIDARYNAVGNNLLEQNFSRENESTEYLVENVSAKEHEVDLLETHNEVTENNQNLMESDGNI